MNEQLRRPNYVLFRRFAKNKHEHVVDSLQDARELPRRGSEENDPFARRVP